MLSNDDNTPIRARLDNENRNSDARRALYAEYVRSDSTPNPGGGYRLDQTNNAIVGVNLAGDPLTFGISGYSCNASWDAGAILGSDTDGSVWGALAYHDINMATWGVYTPFNIYSGGSVGIGTDNPDPNARLDVNGTTRTKVLEITGGSDLAEPFSVSGQKSSIMPGSVVVIDDANPGQLRIGDRPYDTKVAGVISGAGGINPGLTLRQEGHTQGDQKVALSGRVYVLADAAYGSITPGTLLTTSSTPGHAMRASDASRSPGAVIGKAMSSLDSGRGLVLCLVNLQ